MNRRAFLASAAAAGVTASSARSQALAGDDARGLVKDDLPTPALLLDLGRFAQNLRTMSEHCKKAGCGFRPHTKTHKCPEIARRQLASGALGVCVATVAEAEAMAAATLRGILLTSPIIEPRKIARMVALAAKTEVMLSVGHAREVELLDEAARAAKTNIDVLVDIDVGDRRTGIPPEGPALALGRLISQRKNLRLRGLQAYAGHASHAVGFAERSKVSQEAMARAVATRDLFTKSGLKTSILSGGSTGTYNIDSAIQGVTELQVGSYVFMDLDYRRIGGRTNASVYEDFQPSLTVLTTVVSVSHDDRVTVDAGTKALDRTVPLRPQPKNREGLSYNFAGDEFGTLTGAKGTTLPRLGERIELIVPHCDPTTNLYDRIYAMRGDRVEATWPIMARRETGQIALQ